MWLKVSIAESKLTFSEKSRSILYNMGNIKAYLLSGWSVVGLRQIKTISDLLLMHEIMRSSTHRVIQTSSLSGIVMCYCCYFCRFFCRPCFIPEHLCGGGWGRDHVTTCIHQKNSLFFDFHSTEATILWDFIYDFILVMEPRDNAISSKVYAIPS